MRTEDGGGRRRTEDGRGGRRSGGGWSACCAESCSPAGDSVFDEDRQLFRVQIVQPSDPLLRRRPDAIQRVDDRKQVVGRAVDVALLAQPLEQTSLHDSPGDSSSGEAAAAAQARSQTQELACCRMLSALRYCVAGCAKCFGSLLGPAGDRQNGVDRADASTGAISRRWTGDGDTQEHCVRWMMRGRGCGGQRLELTFELPRTLPWHGVHASVQTQHRAPPHRACWMPTLLRTHSTRLRWSSRRPHRSRPPST